MNNTLPARTAADQRSPFTPVRCSRRKTRAFVNHRREPFICFRLCNLLNEASASRLKQAGQTKHLFLQKRPSFMCLSSRSVWSVFQCVKWAELIICSELIYTKQHTSLSPLNTRAIIVHMLLVETNTITLFKQYLKIYFKWNKWTGVM